MDANSNLLTTMGIDGQKWAEEFCKRFPQCQVDDTLGWFCNAIMAGYDAGRLAGIKEVVETYKRDNPGDYKKHIAYWKIKEKEWGI